MLQEAVEALVDNGRRGLAAVITGANKRPMKIAALGSGQAGPLSGRTCGLSRGLSDKLGDVVGRAQGCTSRAAERKALRVFKRSSIIRGLTPRDCRPRLEEGQEACRKGEAAESLGHPRRGHREHPCGSTARRTLHVSDPGIRAGLMSRAGDPTPPAGVARPFKAIAGDTISRARACAEAQLEAAASDEFVDQ